MDTYQIMSLMIGSGMFVLTLISLIIVLIKAIAKKKK
ncbi:putative holin-like toxin [Anaerobacterium chartisolvens]|uniref:Putative holin-like toxin n=1 Tax=Anaerobacterium chartisolvens TaxID=1297424 RepID=A0A369AHV5_9FIRM|nr:putative holin-like toxin [Anaerobacterium chartisolvens]RCX07876.1 putative holin-like toxin [Anaerobacterium chartisolvens]